MPEARAAENLGRPFVAATIPHARRYPNLFVTSRKSVFCIVQSKEREDNMHCAIQRTPMEPTAEAYAELDSAYGYFNSVLFAGALPKCLITLQRERKTYGYFSSERFVRRSGERTDEIAMNPSYFALRSIEDVLSTLVHEMAHLWQAHFGKPGRGRYHNAEWAMVMDSLGLTPTDTGQEGGKWTGDRMTHLIVPGGPFARACADLMTSDFTLSWLDRFPPYSPFSSEDGEDLEGMGIEVQKSPKNKSNRIKYGCPNCEAKAWGKPGLALRCGSCEAGPAFEEVG